VTRKMSALGKDNVCVREIWGKKKNDRLHNFVNLTMGSGKQCIGSLAKNNFK
jgi:hypothetical protein